MLKKLLTVALVTGALFSLTATTAFAKSVNYSHYDDRNWDHWHYNTPDYDIYDDWDYWEVNHSNDDYYYYYDEYDNDYYHDWDYNYYDEIDYYDYDYNYTKNYFNDYKFNLNLDLDDNFNYVVQPFIYQYATPAIAPVMNYYFPPFSYYVY